MYIPKHFEVTDVEEICAFVKAHAFGQITSSVQGRLFTSHIPFLIDDDLLRICGHLARQNPQWESLEDQEVLVTFLGPHDYISPSWYQSPGVPTWNYQAVHFYGHCKAIHETEQLKQIVNLLTHTYESTQSEPWQATYTESMLKNIVGLEIQITEIQCKYKLSQNRSMADRERVSVQLRNSGNIELSDAIERGSVIERSAV